MKILLIGSDHVWSLEKIFYKYLVQLNNDVELFPAQNYFYSYYNKSVINKMFYRAGVSSVINKINKRLIKTIETFQPDIAWVFKGMEILPSTLELMKRKGVFLVNYNPDNPFIFSGTGSGNNNIIKSLSKYNLHFTYNLEVKKQFESMGLKSALLPFGFDLSETLYNKCNNQTEMTKVCFLGNPDKYRATFIKSIADKGIEIDLYGNGWERFINHQNVYINPPVFGEDFWMVLSRYRIQLNLMRPHNEKSHNMRSFEIPAIGGIMLAPCNIEHKAFFKDGTEVFLFTDLKDCIVKIKQILLLPQSEADRIRKNARERCLQSGYSYKERISASVKNIKELI